MPEYEYQVRDPMGGSAGGVLSASSIDEAGRLLRRDGRTIVALHEAVRRPGPAAALRRVCPDDILFFSNQLAVMVETGVPLTEALDCIAAQSTHTGLAAMVKDIANRVKSGTEFSAALACHPRCFDNLYVNMVRASEASGTLGAMLERVCQYVRGQREIRKQVRGAMIYPVCLLVFCVGIVIAMMAFVMPRFKGIYHGKGVALPGPTQAMMNASDFMVNNWALLLGGLILTGVPAAIYLRRPAGQAFLDGVRLRLPLLGPLYRKVYIARSLRTLATMLESGVEVLEGLSITAAVAGNSLFAVMWKRVMDRLKEGRALSDELFASPLMPRSVAQMVASGEKAGRLPKVLDRIADFCEADLRSGIRTMTTLIEPALIVIMGAVVGLIAISLLLPVFSISKVVAH